MERNKITMALLRLGCGLIDMPAVVCRIWCADD